MYKVFSLYDFIFTDPCFAFLWAAYEQFTSEVFEDSNDQ